MKVAAIIQARMGSTRLPGKILKTVKGKPLLKYQIERVKQAKAIDQIIIATTTKESEQPIVDLCEKMGINYYRGSEEDVLSRYYEAAQKFDVDVIVRLTSDCPIIDPKVIDKVVNKYVNNQSSFDYVSNTLERTYPRGLDTEVFSFEALNKAYHEAVLTRDKEHVTAYFYTNPHLFKLQGLKNEKDYGNYRWTVDTEEDFELIRLILGELYNPNKTFHLEDVIKLLNDYPEWNEINAHIEQKKLLV
ncbi:glycosyltransferase family protein [Bacillus sp. DTU_2020_1000418_1_SI_GHA_SEK_038]|uniref:glycosyltransferase family protein n=1 Tax=Bacillus sp. DTU_2020_1000418_1_SI_GHA_SEK_038 TaxID=3077585 RepID=UPI0028EA5381|nr:glycosyltransferase family protein [Bacillus sp. DTU_2020_1000418_1_SI_GHA_SEK_038]WNS75211.1 glycosyltransferase family protein [Bacillus sp. DTU_2020_1000418_1_SI_GHA_SEK_038]